MATTMISKTAASVAAVVLAAGLAGCSKTDTVSDTTEDAAQAVTLSDQWVKAAPTGMTAMFGTLKNSSDKTATLVSATSPSAGMVELHEVVSEGGTGTMRPKEGGIEIPAGGNHVLAPGADHIMLMDLKGPLAVGNTVEVTLTFSDGSALPVSAQVREFAGAAEDYKPNSAPAGHPAGHHG